MSNCEHEFEVVERLYDYSGVTQYITEKCAKCGVEKYVAQIRDENGWGKQS